ncbi:type II secretion system ATPase GspE [Marinicella sp. W31]|uniref:type II secretion system ATPase GspE n=1 Tax=Marinicella sp. W31 TaxID=3023713 RepID=UPI0037581BD0
MSEEALVETTEATEIEKEEPQDTSFEARFCAYMVEKERLREEDLQRGERLNRESFGVSIVPLLVRLGLASERDVATSLNELLELPIMRDKEMPETVTIDSDIPIRFMRENQLVPIGEDNDSLSVVMVYPYEEFSVKALKMVTQKELKISIGFPSEVENAISKYFSDGKSAMGQIVEGMSEESGDIEDVEHLKDLASEAPVIRLVNMIMQRAVESRASDIHIEPFENRLKVRYRVDGVLHEVESPPARSTAAVISRVKIMAKLNIAERRLPQDGRIMLRVQGKELDLRVSTVPTSYGESVVMRILDRESIVFDFHQLGFRENTLEPFLKVLDLPHGILLVTGPTGSGKTTTLYTALQRLNTEDRKIITVEDPVEYQLTGINQIQAKSSIGLDFSTALRAIVRQDPDIIMIGEMRDLETAKIAIQSALTGHMVLSTIHTNSAAGGITRMIDMGVEDYLLTSTINGILAQRLVRKLDQSSMEKYPVMAEMEKELNLKNLAPKGEHFFYRAQPSAENPTGYSGRMSILECLTMSEEIRRLVMQNATAGELQRQAMAEGMLTMYQDGLMKCLVGDTSFEEVIRVTQE